MSGFAGPRLDSTNTALAARLAPLGIRCVAVDLSGHGDSGGTIRAQTLTKASQEIADVLHHVRENNIPLGLMGNSFSANAAILTTARTDLSALALKSPVTDYVTTRTAQVGSEAMKLWRAQGRLELPTGTVSDYAFIEDAASVDTYAELAKIQAPVLAVHGSADELIPAASRTRLANEMAELGMTHHVIEGGDHRLRPPHFDSVLDTFARFLSEHLAP